MERLPVQVTAEQLGELAGELQGLYEAVPGQDGVHQIRLDPGNSGLTLANVGVLETTLGKERKAAREARTKLSAFGDLDPNAARDAYEFKTRFDAGELDDESKARVDNIERGLAEKYGAKEQALLNKVSETEKRSNEREAQLVGQLSKAIVGSSVTEAISKHEGNLKILTPLVSSRVQVVEEDGKFVRRILNDQGEPMYSRRTGSTTEFMDVDEYVGTLAADDDLAPAFSGTKAGGSGSPAGGKGAPIRRGQVTISKDDAKVPQKFWEAQKRAKEAGTDLVIV